MAHVSEISERGVVCETGLYGRENGPTEAAVHARRMLVEPGAEIDIHSRLAPFFVAHAHAARARNAKQTGESRD